MRARRNRAFTLVEILIVVVILGILAAVVIPQFVNASDEAQVGNVETQLRTLRTQVQLFRAQSDTNDFPALVEGEDDGAVAWAAMIDEQLLQAAPVNPRTNSSTLTFTEETGVAGMDEAMADGDVGWFFNEETGELWAASFNENYRDPDDEDTGEPWPAGDE
ncbi:MAG: type II secretion system protein [Phycisphaera sp.]|nr:MAG: type II secretion system protein [Phycisphaera sp.]